LESAVIAFLPPMMPWHDSCSSGKPELSERGKTMLRVNVSLDPSRTSRDAGVLETNLQKLIVGQDEAIQQIVNVYKMYQTKS
jgi:hypothetical protein